MGKVLAIDFGTSNCAVASRDGTAPAEAVEIAGDRRAPSVVYVTDSGELMVGRVADDLALSNPERALRAPKAHLGEPHPVVIAGRPWDTSTLVTAVLRSLAEEADSQGLGGSSIRLTHPATWSGPRREQLRRAALAAGLSEPTLIPEPVAAAMAYADPSPRQPGEYVSVYDLGGGTFDTTVLRAGEAGTYEIVGRPTGDGQIGGELFDELLMEEVRGKLAPEAEEALVLAENAQWQQAGARLRVEVRRAKETLSSHPYADVVVATPTGFERVRITRDDLEALIRPYLEESVAVLARSVADAGLQRTDLAAVLLAGGASRMPLVESLLREAFPGVPIVRRSDPKMAVALGAALMPDPPPGEPVPAGRLGWPAPDFAPLSRDPETAPTGGAPWRLIEPGDAGWVAPGVDPGNAGWLAPGVDPGLAGPTAARSPIGSWSPPDSGWALPADRPQEPGSGPPSGSAGPGPGSGGWGGGPTSLPPSYGPGSGDWNPGSASVPPVRDRSRWVVVVTVIVAAIAVIAAVIVVLTHGSGSSGGTLPVSPTTTAVVVSAPARETNVRLTAYDPGRLSLNRPGAVGAAERGNSERTAGAWRLNPKRTGPPPG